LKNNFSYAIRFNYNKNNIRSEVTDLILEELEKNLLLSKKFHLISLNYNEFIKLTELKQVEVIKKHILNY